MFQIHQRFSNFFLQKIGIEWNEWDQLKVFFWLKLTSLLSKSKRNAHNLNLAGNSEMDANVNRNCSALPKGNSGLAIWNTKEIQIILEY